MSSNIERCVTLDKISGNCVNKLWGNKFFLLKFRIHFWERFVLFASLRETGFSGKWGFPLGKVFKNRTYEKIYVSTDWGSSLTFGEKYKPCACFLPTNPHPVSESNHFVIAFRTSWYLPKSKIGRENQETLRFCWILFWSKPVQVYWKYFVLKKFGSKM